MSAILEMPASTVRSMCPDDLDRVMEIELSAYDFPWTAGIFRDCLRVGYSCCVLECGDGIVGYAVMSIAAGESHILNLCVHPGHQRMGYGRALLHHLLYLARRLGADTALLEVRPTNRGALALYRKEGFCEVGVRHNYYPHARGREDALILALDLTGGR